MFSVFANFKIDTDRRFKALKISFNSINDKKIDNWVINIRGKYTKQTKKFLLKNCKSKIDIFNIETSKGWMHDSKKILKYIKSNYVLFWIEDHICLKNKRKYLFECVKDLKKNNIDQMLYSFWHNKNYLQGLENTNKKKTKNITFYNLNEKNLEKIQNNRIKLKLKPIGFIINVTSIFKKELFEKLIKIRKPWKRRYNKLLPFDFEKRIQDKFWLPISQAIPNKEIFASLDDDHGEKGYSLMSRKLYKNFFIRKKEVESREISLLKKKHTLIGRFVYFIKNQFNFF